MLEGLQDWSGYLKNIGNLGKINIGGFNLGFIFANKELAVALLAVGILFIIIIKMWIETPFQQRSY